MLSLEGETNVSKRNVLVLGVVLCAMLATGFVAGQAATRAPVPPFRLTAVPPNTGGIVTPSFLLTDSRSSTIKLITVMNRDWENMPGPKLRDLRRPGIGLVVLAEFDLSKLPAGDIAGDGTETTPSPKP
jgi:hypothetical protein